MAVGSFAMQQLRSAAEQAWDIRWQIASDMNGDGVVTIADVGLWIKWIFLAPGDFLVLLTLIYATPIALFLEISTENISGFMSAALSLFTWLLIVVVLNR